jgi:hypothetical protein
MYIASKSINSPFPPHSKKCNVSNNAVPAFFNNHVEERMQRSNKRDINVNVIAKNHSSPLA